MGRRRHRYWPNGSDIKFPPFFSRASFASHPIIAAARVNAILGQSYFFGYRKHQHLGTLLREAAQSQRDAYYRYWFKELADRLDEAVEKEKLKSSFSGFANFFGGSGGGDRDADDDTECDCPKCRAAKQRAAERARPPERTLF